MNTNISFMNSDKLKLNDKKYVVFVDFLFVFVVAIEYLREIMKKIISVVYHYFFLTNTMSS